MLREFLSLSWETGSEPYTSGIQLIEITTGKKNQGKDTSTNESITYDLDIENTAVFKKDHLAGWMDNQESMGLLWVKGEIKGGIIPVTFDDKKISLKIVRMNSEIKPFIVDEKMQVHIRINLFTNIGESQANLDFEKDEVIQKIEKLQAEVVKKQIIAALDKSRRLNSDVFVFGNYFLGKYPKIWKQIEANRYDYYRNIEVNVDVNSTVNQIGLIKKAADIGIGYGNQQE